MKHWQALIDHEDKFLPSLELAYKLTPRHLNPKGYEKMNVQLAYDVKYQTYFGHGFSNCEFFFFFSYLVYLLL